MDVMQRMCDVLNNTKQDYAINAKGSNNTKQDYAIKVEGPNNTERDYAIKVEGPNNTKRDYAINAEGPNNTKQDYEINAEGPNNTKQDYAIYVEGPEEVSPELTVAHIKYKDYACFHMAFRGTNRDIENAIQVYAQALLYRTTEKDPVLYYAVIDSGTHIVYLCTCDPLKGEYNVVRQQRFIQKESQTVESQTVESQMAEELKTYIVSNAKEIVEYGALA